MTVNAAIGSVIVEPKAIAGPRIGLAVIPTIIKEVEATAVTIKAIIVVGKELLNSAANGIDTAATILIAKFKVVTVKPTNVEPVIAIEVSTGESQIVGSEKLAEPTTAIVVVTRSDGLCSGLFLMSPLGQR